MQAQISDKEKIKQLWAYAFNEQEPFLSEYFDNFWKAENALILKENEKLVGALHMTESSVSIRSSELDASYVVGVSVAEEFRGRKFSTVLMRDCLIEQKKRGETLSLLIPFNYEFYKKLGYRLCYCLNMYETEPDNLPAPTVKQATKYMSIENYRELDAAYRAFCSDKNGYIIRSRSDWEYIFFETRLFGGAVLAVYSGEEVSGYASYIKKNDEIFVRELVFCDSESLFNLLEGLSSECKKIKLRTAEDDVLLNLLKNPKNVMKRLPTVMARITDVCRALMTADTGGLKIKVEDSLIAENSGVYEKDGASFRKTESGDFDAAMDIGTLTQLVTGFLSAEELALSGLIWADGECIKKLGEAFPKRKNYINHVMEE